MHRNQCAVAQVNLIRVHEKRSNTHALRTPVRTIKELWIDCRKRSTDTNAAQVEVFVQFDLHQQKNFTSFFLFDFKYGYPLSKVHNFDYVLFRIQATFYPLLLHSVCLHSAGFCMMFHRSDKTFDTSLLMTWCYFTFTQATNMKDFRECFGLRCSLNSRTWNNVCTDRWQLLFPFHLNGLHLIQFKSYWNRSVRQYAGILLRICFYELCILQC